MTNEEALRRIKAECIGCCHPQAMEYCERNCEYGIAIECIEKQIPKKPIFDGVQDEWTGCLLFYSVQCPHCHNVINKYNGDYARELVDYCECCGQAIDWSDING